MIITVYLPTSLNKQEREAFIPLTHTPHKEKALTEATASPQEAERLMTIYATRYVMFQIVARLVAGRLLLCLRVSSRPSGSHTGKGYRQTRHEISTLMTSD